MKYYSLNYTFFTSDRKFYYYRRFWYNTTYPGYTVIRQFMLNTTDCYVRSLQKEIKEHKFKNVIIIS